MRTKALLAALILACFAPVAGAQTYGSKSANLTVPSLMSFNGIAISTLLPDARQYTGYTVYTSDQGPMYSNGTAWFPYGSTGSAPIPVNSTGGSAAFATTNPCQIIMRSNAGIAMSDTLTGTIGCAVVVNIDASATDTISPAVGTIAGTATLALLPGQSATIYAFAGNYQVTASDPLTPGPATVTSLTASGAVAANALVSSTTVTAGGKITSGDAIYSTGGTLPTSTIGQGSFVGDATNGLRMQGWGSAWDYQLFNGSGNLICETGHGTNTLACQQLTVTGTSVGGNGLYRPVSNQLGFMSNGLSAGILDSGQHPRFGGSGTPTISSGACGATSNGTLASGASDVSGKIQIGASATTTCTVTFASGFDTVARAVILQPANSAAAGQVANVFVSSITTSTFVVTGTAMASTNWYYYVQ